MRTFYHEAGHCVIARLFGYKVVAVTFFQDGRACTLVNKKDDSSKENICTFLMAGRMAELVKFGDFSSSFQDVTAAFLAGEWDQDLVMACQEQARSLLKANWPLVEEIAAKLRIDTRLATYCRR